MITEPFRPRIHFAPSDQPDGFDGIPQREEVPEPEGWRPFGVEW